MEQKSYGISYQGSKNLIARKIVAMMTPPPNERKNTIFADIFFGGGAITHCAIEQNIASYYVGNDINRDMIDLFGNALTGKYRNENRWISREEFEKSKDPFIRLMWSFNNGRTSYLYSREIEPYKKAYHYAVCFNDTSLFAKMGITFPPCDRTDMKERRIFYRQYITANYDTIKQQYIQWYGSTHANTDYEYMQSIDTGTSGRKTMLEHVQHEMKIQKLQNIENIGFSDKEHIAELTQLERLQRLQNISLENNVSLKNSNYLQRLNTLDRGWVCTEDIYYWHKIYKKGNITLNLTTGEYYDMFSYVTNIASEIDDKLTREHKNSTEDFYPHIIFYCDPPYINTAGYGKEDHDKTTFDHERFYKWCELYTMTEQNIEIFISEKYMPEDRFVCILEMQKINNFAQGGQICKNQCDVRNASQPTNAYTEKLFVPKRQWERHKAKYIQRALKIVAEEEKTNISNTILQTENISQQGMYNLF